MTGDSRKRLVCRAAGEVFGVVQYSVKLYNTALAPPEAAFYKQELEVPDDFKAEAWALGALLLELLTGRTLTDMKANKQLLVGCANPLDLAHTFVPVQGHLPGPPRGHTMLCGSLLSPCLPVLGCPVSLDSHLSVIQACTAACFLGNLLPAPLQTNMLLCMLARRCHLLLSRWITSGTSLRSGGPPWQACWSRSQSGA